MGHHRQTAYGEHAVRAALSVTRPYLNAKVIQFYLFTN